MIKSVQKKPNDLRSKIISMLMVNGKKKTGEKILLKFAKRLQKSTDKNFKNLLQTTLINSTPTFKINEQIVRKGKRKAVKVTPTFIVNDSLRVTTALKFFKNVVSKNKSSEAFYETFAKEVLASSVLKSQVVDKKNELQKQVLINKRYLSKFRW